MKNSIGMLVKVLVPAVMLAFATATPAMKHEGDKGKAEAKDAKAAPAKAVKGKPTQKVLQEDDRVRVTETTYKPGDVSDSLKRGYRVTRAIKGGTFERTYADGKKEKVERKTGSVMIQGPDKEAWANKNIGKSDIVIYSVTIKSPK